MIHSLYNNVEMWRIMTENEHCSAVVQQLKLNTNRRDRCSRIWYWKPSPNTAAFYGMQVCGIRKKKAWHMLKKLAHISGTSF